MIHSSCGMFSSTFKRLNFQFEDSSLNYVQTKTIGDFKMKSKQIDLFDRSFLTYLKAEIRKKKYVISGNNFANISYRLTNPAIEIQFYQKESDKLIDVYTFKASLGGLLYGVNKKFLLIEDSISCGLIPLNRSVKEEIPAWAKEQSANCIQLEDKNYFVVLEDNQIVHLAKSLGMKTIQTIENQFKKDLQQKSLK